MPDLDAISSRVHFSLQFFSRNARRTSTPMLEASGQLYSLLTPKFSPVKGYELKLFRSTVCLRFGSWWSWSRGF